MNDEYTKMIQSVKLNGGFYIGRYETTLANGVVGSKINVQPMDSRALTSSNSSANTWYGEYYYQDSNRCETNPYYGSEDITSSMIWGSQYESMLNWVLKGEDSNMVYKIIGNHSGSRAVTGAWGVDIMNNIFEIFTPDSIMGRLASTVQGSTDTTFYVLALSELVHVYNVKSKSLLIILDTSVAFNISAILFLGSNCVQFQKPLRLFFSSSKFFLLSFY